MKALGLLRNALTLSKPKAHLKDSEIGVKCCSGLIRPCKITSPALFSTMRLYVKNRKMERALLILSKRMMLFPVPKLIWVQIRLAVRPGEAITEGLDGLRNRLAEYYKLGARFAKWRAVIEISHPDQYVGMTPSRGAIKANNHALARYASLCQEAGIVPIVEPEVLMGGYHNVARCHEVTERVLNSLFTELYEQGVKLEGTILKPNMVIAGLRCADQPSVEEVAERTIKVLKDTVPAAVPGIAFLSGGQTNEVATEHLNMINKIGDFPWNITYSYGRALQQSALFAWKGKPENYAASQAAFYHRAKMNCLTSVGQWTSEQEAAGPT